VFEHLCLANELTIDSKYLLKALKQAEIIEKPDLYSLQVAIEEVVLARQS